jgi:hypothetical protein
VRIQSRAPLKCVHCNAAFSPAVWDWVPDVFWSVSFTCPKCDKENHVPWLVSAGLMLLAMAVVLLVMVLGMVATPIRLPGGLFAVVTAASLFAVFAAMLSKYLHSAKHPLRGRP